MATITTSWTTIASKTWKSGSFNVKFLLQARLISQSVSNNSSVIQTRLRSERASYSFGGWPYKFTCSYCTSKSGDSTWTIETENILVSSNKTANHNADGTKSLSLSATAVISGLGMNVSLSGTATLPKINRIVDLTSWPNFTDDENNPVVIQFNNPANYKMNFFIDIYDDNEQYLTTFSTEIDRYPNYIALPFSAVDWNYIRNVCKYQKKYNVVVGINTYDNNENYIGDDTANRTLTIVNANPTFDATYQDINSTTTSITEDNQKIIRNQSNLQINISNAEGKKYATLSSVKAVINGITYNGTLSGTTGTIGVGTIDVSENINAAVTLTDSRGYTTTNNIELQVLNWELPTANISLARQNNYYSETDIKVDANYSSLDGDNVITIKERHKKTSEQNYSAYTTLTDNVTSTITLDNLYEWDVQVLVQDLFGSTTYNLTLDKGMPIIYFDRLKRSVSINSFPQNNESLEVLGGDILEIIGDKTDTWSSSGSYATGDFVAYERYIYKNLTGTNSATPDTDTTNWKKVSILELMKDIEAGGGGGTTNYNDLGNKPSINNVTLSGNKSLSDLGINIPTTTSQLTNNSGFITNSVNNLTNYTLSSALSSVATSGDYDDLSNKPTIPTKTSDLTNDSGFITNSVSDLTNYTKTTDLGAVALSNDYDDLTNKPTIKSPTNSNSQKSVGWYGNASSIISDLNSTNYLIPNEYVFKIKSTTTGIPTELGTLLSSNELALLKTYSNSYQNKGSLDATRQELYVPRITNKWWYRNISGTMTFGNWYEVATTDEIPTKVSDLQNDSGYTTNTGTITSVKMNGSTISSSGEADLGTVITSHQSIKTINNTSLVGTGNITLSTFSGSYNDLTNKPTIPSKTSDLQNDSGYITSSYHDSSKQDTLVSGTNIKTINNTSLLGSGNITIGGGGTATDVQINGTSITSGGTANILTNGTYSSSNKIATMSDIPTPTVLYNNTDGSNASITLTDNVSNYSYLEIFYGWASFGSKSTKYDVALGGNINLDTSALNNNYIYWASSEWTPTTNKINLDKGEYWRLGTSGSGARNTNNRIWIYKVLGYK